MQPVQVETGSSTIFRFDHILDADTCQQLYQYVLSVQRIFKIDTEKFPWFEGDSFSWFDIPNKNLKKTIYERKNIANQLINECFKKTLYPEFTDIVLWKTGRKMVRHLDDGHQTDAYLKYRVVSSVIYVNDDYTGGETFIATEHNTDYISRPKVGSMVCYLSNEQNSHGVNEVTSGNRITLPVWYCEEFDRSETLREEHKIKEITSG
jgi:predicted 2-oxoglutarate/Fe(II)-dependent dioxygenase YbiX